MTRLDPAVIEEAIRLQEAEELYTMEGLQVHYSCYALASAQGEHYDDIRFDEYRNICLKAYKYFTRKRFGLDKDFGSIMPIWWNICSSEYKQERLENLRLFKEAVEKGEIN
jgi:hypothetical protein